MTRLIRASKTQIMPMNRRCKNTLDRSQFLKKAKKNSQN